MRCVLFLALLACSVFVPRVHSQVASTGIVQLDGKTVEVVGLRSWTVEMIQDSLTKYAPGVTLDSHACAAALRYQLGFSDAAVTVYPGDNGLRFLVTVVEPQDSGRVLYRPASYDTAGTRTEWQTVTGVISENFGAFQAAVLSYIGGAYPSDTSAISAEAQLHDFLRSHQSEADRENAYDTVLNDRNLYHRILATALLANFPGNDSTWHVLVEALRESDGPVKLLAGSMLGGFATHHARTVDWRPATQALHAILNGTSLFGLPMVLRVLLVTGVDSKMAKPLLKGGGEMVLAYLKAEHEQTRETARSLLMTVADMDLGSDPEKWRVWIASLLRAAYYKCHSDLYLRARIDQEQLTGA